MKSNMKVVLIQTVLLYLITVSCMFSLICSIDYISNIANIWWQVCLGWCWLVLSISILIVVVFLICIVSNKYY